jgi:hypothetical protein
MRLRAYAMMSRNRGCGSMREADYTGGGKSAGMILCMFPGHLKRDARILDKAVPGRMGSANRRRR